MAKPIGGEQLRSGKYNLFHMDECSSPHTLILSSMDIHFMKSDDGGGDVRAVAEWINISSSTGVRGFLPVTRGKI